MSIGESRTRNLAVAGLAGLALALLALGLRSRPAGAAFPGANGKIVFVSDRDGDFEVFTMNSDGSHQRQTTDNTVHDWFPCYSPSGRWIAFSRGDEERDVLLMRPDGSHVTRLTHSNADDVFPDF